MNYKMDIEMFVSVCPLAADVLAGFILATLLVCDRLFHYNSCNILTLLVGCQEERPTCKN